MLIKCGLKGVKVGIESAETNVLKEEGRFTAKKDEQLSKIRELEKNNSYDKRDRIVEILHQFRDELNEK